MSSPQNRTRGLLALAAIALLLAIPAGAEEAAATSPSLCTASATDEECARYWERHINWWSLDYRESSKQLPEHRHMPPPFGFALVNFAVFVAIIYRLAGKPLREFVQARHFGVRQELESAAAMHRAAAKKLKLYEEKLDRLEGEIERLVEGARRDATADKEHLIAKAGEEAARLRRDAEARMASELAEVRQALRREVVDASLDLAERLLRERVGAAERRELAENALAGLESLSSEKNVRPRG